MRHAIYFAPAPAHPLWRAGCDWLGRGHDGIAAGAPARDGVAAPWRYGFHATLKAPLRLAEGRHVDSWREALRDFAARQVALALPPLAVVRLGDFLALRPGGADSEPPALRQLADDCVEQFDPWRAPPDAAERARRFTEPLTRRQHELLECYGYPHVLEQWRFHLTLSDAFARRDPPSFERLQREATAHFETALAEPLVCDALCWFVEPAPGAPFELRERFAFGA